MITLAPVAAQRKRLLDVVKALRDAEKNPHFVEDFTMQRFVNVCGTPGCALGHYAARLDLQTEFRLSTGIDAGLCYAQGYGSTMRESWNDSSIRFCDLRLLEYFGLTQDEFDELFEADGCNTAVTPIEAALYIEDFVVAKWPQWVNDARVPV